MARFYEYGLTAVARRLLSVSRNLFPALPFQAVGGVGDVRRDFIQACIDIEEPLTLRAGETRDVTFRYRAGVPRSTGFDLQWFATEADAEQLRNPLDSSLVVLPLTSITPSAPVADSGTLQVGIATIRAPQEMGAIYNGAIIIHQPDGKGGGV